MTRLELELGQYDMTACRVFQTHSDLLNFCKVICRIAVEGHLSKRGHRDQLLRDEFGRIQNVEPILELIGFIHDLDTKLEEEESVYGAIQESSHQTDLPFWVHAVVNCVPDILTLKVCILSTSCLGLFPQQTSSTLQRLPVPLHKLSLAIFGDKAHGVDSETVDMTIGTRQTIARHDQHNHVECAGLLSEEVVRCIVCGSGLWHGFVGLRFEGVYHVRKQDSIVDEEDGEIDADDVFNHVS